MKLGILGTGMIVKDLLTTINQLSIEKLSILGTNQTKEETETLAKKYHIQECFYDYQELLKSDVDTIYVALPNHLHYRFAKEALFNHKHVIIEKPITANTKELKDLMSIAKQNHLIILEAMNIHYLPAFQSLKQNIQNIGKPKIININYSQYSSRYDAFKQGTILPAFDYKKAGGALMDINVYNIHTIVGIFGKPASIQYNANIEHHIDTSGILTMDYNSFKVICIGAKDCKAPILSSFQGDQGTILIHTPANQMRKYQFINNQNEEKEYTFDENNHRLYYEFKEFIRIIDNTDFNKAHEMLELSYIVSEIMEKARKQERIEFDNDK